MELLAFFMLLVTFEDSWRRVRIMNFQAHTQKSLMSERVRNHITKLAENLD